MGIDNPGRPQGPGDRASRVQGRTGRLGDIALTRQDREKSFTQEDVIAYMPPLSWLASSPASPTGAAESNPGDTPAVKVLGNALGSGLVHWARYCNVLRRSHTNSTLGQALQVRLRAGRDAQAMIEGKADDTASRPQEPDAQGVYQLTERDYLWVEVNLTRDVPGGVALGILLCSNDGNIILGLARARGADGRWRCGRRRTGLTYSRPGEVHRPGRFQPRRFDRAP